MIFYTTKTGREIDFVAQDNCVNIRAYQVTHDMSALYVRTHEVQALADTMLELDLDFGLIVTFDHAEIIEVDERTINCIPASEFLCTDPLN